MPVGDGSLCDYSLKAARELAVIVPAMNAWAMRSIEELGQARRPLPHDPWHTTCRCTGRISANEEHGLT